MTRDGKFDRVLFVRVDGDLLAKLDVLVAKRQEESPYCVSRSAVVRNLLQDGVETELMAWGEGGEGS